MNIIQFLWRNDDRRKLEPSEWKIVPEKSLIWKMEGKINEENSV